MNRISLCMIVRNEEDTIAHCLQSAIELVDEIIVVDTGSTDRTMEICRVYGAKIHRFHWENDFSAARNESLVHASREWILVLDADDELPKDSHTQIRKLIDGEGHDAFFFITRNLVGDPQHPTILNYAQLRLFRNHINFRYQGAIHELIPKVPSVKFQVAPTIFVLHRGYLDTMVKNHKKVERNLSILNTELTRKPTDASLHYYIGNEFLRDGKLTDATHHYEQAMTLLRTADREQWLPDLPSKYAYALWQMGQIELAIAVVQQAIARSPEYTDLWFLLGSLYLDQQRMNSARLTFEKCRQLGEPPPIFPTQEGCATYLPTFYLGVISLADKNIASARTFFEESLGQNSHNVPTAIQLCLCDWIEEKYESIQVRIQEMREQKFDEWVLDLLERIHKSLVMKQSYINRDDPNHVASFITCLSTLSLYGQTRRVAQIIGSLPAKIHVTAMKEAWYYEVLSKYFHIAVETLEGKDG